MTVQVCSQNLAYCVWLSDDASRREGSFEVATLVKVVPPTESGVLPAA